MTARLVIPCVFGIALALRAVAAWWLPLQPDEASSLLERSWAHLMADHEAFFNPVPWRAFSVVWGEWVMTDAGPLALPLLRLPSILAGAVACVLVARGARRGASVHGGRTGGSWPPALVAGLGMACTPWMVRQQAQFRSYGLAALAAAAVAVTMLELLERADQRRALRAGLAVGLAGWAHFVLLPWVGLWAAALARAVGRGRLGRRDAATAAGVVGLLAAGPAWLAWQGFKLKAGGASGSMAGILELHPLWNPEPLLAAVAIAVAAGRRRRAELALAIGATIFGAGLLLAAQQVRTLRWGHLVAVAPAIWLALGAALASPRARARSAIPMVAALGAVLMAGELLGALAAGATRGDFVRLARWVRANKPALLGSAQRGPHLLDTPERADRSPLLGVVELGGDEFRPKALELAFELGYFRGGPERCAGPDVVHARRCRARVCALGRGRRAVLLEGTRLSIDDAPDPPDGALPCEPSIIREACLDGPTGSDPARGCTREGAVAVGNWWIRTIDSRPTDSEARGPGRESGRLERPGTTGREVVAPE